MPKPHIKHTIFLRVPCQVKQIFAIEAGNSLNSVKKTEPAPLQALQQIPIQGGIYNFLFHDKGFPLTNNIKDNRCQQNQTFNNLLQVLVNTHDTHT